MFSASEMMFTWLCSSKLLSHLESCQALGCLIQWWGRERVERTHFGIGPYRNMPFLPHPLTSMGSSLIYPFTQWNDEMHLVEISCELQLATRMAWLAILWTTLESQQKHGYKLNTYWLQNHNPKLKSPSYYRDTPVHGETGPIHFISLELPGSGKRW